MPGAIVVKGARVHNLKNIDVEIPRRRLVVVTGVSGSGKSSLAFDTLYAEGQRRYLESLSTGTRQLLQQLDKPDVDSIDGLSPAVAVRQRSATSGPRSTVATVTDIYDYLRLLFVRVGQPVCVGCGMLISVQTIQEIVDQLLGLPAGTRVVLLAPVTGANKTAGPKLLRELAAQGFTRVRIDGELHELSQGIRLEGDVTGGLDVVIDRLVIRKGVEKRLADSLEVASRVGRQVLKAEVQSPSSTEPLVELRFSRQYACVNCGSAFPELTLGLFSFNSPLGACPGCGGSGRQKQPTDKGEHIGQDAEPPCRVCNGLRLKRESLAVRLADKNIAQVTALPISQAIAFLAGLQLADQHKFIAAHLLGEILERLRSLTQLGVDYLSLDRPLSTLSTGEAQRVRLATQIGSRLMGVLYILDEPSLGLHQKDNTELLKLLKNLRDAGNSVLVVEHDPDIILSADYVIDMGPGAGLAGGQVVSQGTAIELMADPLSATGRYLSGQKKITRPLRRRTGSGELVVIQGARKNNLRDLTVEIPIGAMTCVTGVSGSGKSTLVSDILYDQVSRGLRGSRRRLGAQSAVSGWQHFDRVVQVDQAPIGQTPRANPATYTGIHDHIRELYAQLPEARVRGYKADRFSFNSRAGQCAACRGEGLIRVDMYFLPDIFATCDVCNGQRFNRETLDVRYKGRNIAEVLQLSVVEAAELFGSIAAVAERLRTLASVGLGYLRLGQPSHTLSGGEAQRLKLARELARRTRGRSLYILDEPTAGLHFADVEQLLQLLHRLTDAGNTLVIVEHNLDVIKNADYIIDLGPGGGPNGGAIMARGTPEEVATVRRSDTGRYLARALDDS